MTIEELEQRHDRLRHQFMQVYNDLERLRLSHGLTMYQVHILPDVPHELTEGSPEMKPMADERKKMLDALPGDVRAAAIMLSEVNDLYVDAEIKLAQTMHAKGRSTKEIAERLGRDEETSRQMATA